MSETPKLSADLLKDVVAFIRNDGKTSFSSMELDESLYSACKLVAAYAKIPFTSRLHQDSLRTLDAIANAEDFRFREVKLTPHWWKYDNGALLAFKKTSMKACALIPEGDHYLIFDTHHQKPNILTEDMAQTLQDKAYYFYRIFNEESMSIKSLIAFGLRGVWPELSRILGLQFFIGLLTLFVPIATASLFTNAIPDANYSSVLQWIYILFITSISVIAFDLSRLITEIRMRYLLTLSMQSAVWDRILKLPIQFFKKYTVGDLSMRCSTIDQLQQTLTNVVLNSILLLVFSLIPLILMFYYSVSLAFVAMLLTLGMLSVCIVIEYRQLNYQRELLKNQASQTSWILQMLDSISKLKIANAHERFYGVWSSKFVDNVKLVFKQGYLNTFLDMFNVTISLIMITIIYVLVVLTHKDLTFTAFIGFNASYTLFTLAIFNSVSAFNKIIYGMALYERITPILTSSTEQKNQEIGLKTIEGHILIKELSFHYPHEHNILENINIEIKSGEFVAIIGPSGVGKSTLLKLLMGFEKSTHGDIYFDQVDIHHYNIHDILKQMGVVLQSDVLLPGTIYENICSIQPLSIQEVWNIIDMVAMKEEIENMPMGLYTIVTEGGKTFSTGQRQRIMLARALAKKPKILLLDEATSALDNKTQQVIQHHLSRQKITRIVVAQRLSTIIHADMIYVLNHGTIERKGTYDELRGSL